MIKFLDTALLFASERSIVAAKARGFYRWDARIKLVSLVAAISLNVGLAQRMVSTVLFAAGVIMLLWAAPSVKRTMLFFVAPLFPAALFFIGIAITFGYTSVWHFGSLHFYREGLSRGVDVLLRIYCDISWLALVFLTTPFADILKALRRLRFPGILVDTLALMFRYSFMMYDEFRRMIDAAVSRGGAASRAALLKNIARIAAQIFMRSYDRSRDVYLSMMARGAESSEEEYMEKVPHVKSGSDGTVVCTLSNVSFGYSAERSALNGIDVAIRKGEAVALCGQNGSGKTTLLKICAGLLLPHNGAVEILKTPIDRRTRRTLFRSVGFLFQNSDDQLFCPTVAEDIAFGPANMKLPADEIERRVDEAMTKMQISHLAARPIHDLSFGEKKRVALAGLLAMRTPLLLMDEPTSGLDPASAATLIEMLNELKRTGEYTLLVSTHDMHSVPEFADRIILLDEGRVFRDDSMQTVLNDEEALIHCSLFKRKK